MKCLKHSRLEPQSGSTNLLNILCETFSRSTHEVPLLRDHFSSISTPTSWTDWINLPVTHRELYSRLKDTRHAIRDAHRFFSPAAPLNLSNPEFPITVLQSYEDKLRLDERLVHIFSTCNIRAPERLVLVYGREQRYAASDLVELLVYLGYQCFLILDNSERPARMTDLIGSLAPKAVIWLSSIRPSASFQSQIECELISFNGFPNRPSRHYTLSVIHFDPVPYFAVSKNGISYSVVGDHFYLETLPDGELLMTTLQQDLLPLVRFVTGIYARIREDGFDLIKPSREIL